MATGPEHYVEAERLLGEADHWLDADIEWEASLARRAGDLAAAQVHATLAAAAATALGSQRADDHGMFAEDGNAWLAAASAADWRPPTLAAERGGS